MRWAVVATFAFGLTACTPEPEKSSPQSPRSLEEAGAVTPSDSLCLPETEVNRLVADARPSDEDFGAMMGHFAICHQDEVTARQIAIRLSDAGLPVAMRHVAITNLNMRRDLETVVPLLQRASGLGDETAKEDLRRLVVSTAVADAYGIERIRPPVPIEVPTRFQVQSVGQLIETCRSADLDDEAFCDEAISQIMIETRACRGRPFASSVGAIRERIRRSQPSAQPAYEFLRDQVSQCEFG
ncbi:MAG: hypothetical protein LKF80_16685 [Brevundimonas sp.]|jgi:hypothetical protein|uniref:hypothetical protein n=1 Tax=Brevundimonas sp. TaxID=1871086 RepID=UPI0025BF42C3|nr:hypothetical protein [Brevundimonas sp.]MCH4270029.1 hypothetical protein [Brevundimonas sp.]